MILILIALVTTLIVSALLASSPRVIDELNIAGAIFSMLCLAGLAVYVILGFQYVAAGHKTKIINREYATDYTQAEVFWAEGVIDEIKELNRTRVELNGDVCKTNPDN